MGCGQGEDVFRTFGELLVDERGRSAEQIFQLGPAKDVEFFQGNPMGSSEIGSWNDALNFQEVMEAFG